VASLFSFSPDDMFFLSLSSLTKEPLKKYSITKGKNLEFIYYTPYQEDTVAIKTVLLDKIEKKELESIVSLQRKLLKDCTVCKKVCLDYLYTVAYLSLKQLTQENFKLDDEICNAVFATLVETAKGPIKLVAFKAISHKIQLLIKSLQYIEYDMNSLGPISFSYEQLLETADLSNPDLCKSLTRLILKGVPYQAKWAELLIRMSPRT
jgi:hypothetical protein